MYPLLGDRPLSKVNNDAGNKQGNPYSGDRPGWEFSDWLLEETDGCENQPHGEEPQEHGQYRSTTDQAKKTVCLNPEEYKDPHHDDDADQEPRCHLDLHSVAQGPYRPQAQRHPQEAKNGRENSWDQT